MAAAIFKQQLANAGIDGVFVSSAGLHAQPQEEADLRAKKAAHEFGISLDDHCARLLTHSLVQGADVIFAMDGLNEAELMALYPEAQDKVYMLGRWGDFEGSRRTEIPDPYDGDEADIQQCCEILQSCVRGLTSSLFGKISPRREDSCKSVGSVSCHAR